MTDERDPGLPDKWDDPTRPPWDGAVDLGGGVWAVWGAHHGARGSSDLDHLLIWHWCTESRWVAEGRPHAEPHWVLAGAETHTLVSRDPLHLEPSLYWPDCCGKHGFIREGRWVEV